jgi:hypothetical protein
MRCICSAGFLAICRSGIRRVCPPSHISPWARLTIHRECWVDNSLNEAYATATTDCNQPCDGNQTELCGAGNRIQVYADLPAAPTIVPSVGTFQNSGCFVDSVSARVLVAESTTDLSSTGMTVEKCVAFAQEGGWKYAGVEYGGYA